MDKCLAIQKQIPQFLEDMLVESAYQKVRNHLKTCNLCHGHVLRLGSLAADLKRIGAAEIPFNLALRVQEGVAKKMKGESSTGSYPSKMVWGIILALLLAGPFSGYFIGSRQNTQIRESAEPMKSAEEAKPLAMRQLEAIDARLNAAGAHSRSAGELNALHKNQRNIAIQPLVWKAYFLVRKHKKNLAGGLEAIADKIIFSSDHALIIELKSSNLETAAELIEKTGARLSGDIRQSIRNMPQTDKNIQVSILMLSELDDHDPRKTLYWEVRFLRKDSYALRDKLKQAGIQFLYESSDLWVIEVSSLNFSKFRKIVKAHLALQFNEGSPDQPAEISGSSAEVVLRIENS